MMLFEQLEDGRQEVEVWVRHKEANNAKLFVHREMNKGKHVLPNEVQDIGLWKYDGSILSQSKAFHDGRLYFHLSVKAIDWYHNKYYTSLNNDFYLHAIGCGLMKGLYMIYAGDPDKCYVGKVDRTFTARWKEHHRALRLGQHHTTRLQQQFNKTGLFLPMILAGTMQNGQEKDIKEWETKFINVLWQNNYNTRKF